MWHIYIYLYDEFIIFEKEKVVKPKSKLMKSGMMSSPIKSNIILLYIFLFE